MLLCVIMLLFHKSVEYMWESGQWWMIFLTAHGSENLFINLLTGSKIEHNAILCAEFFYLMWAPHTQEN